jgi:hypothetical protein
MDTDAQALRAPSADRQADRQHGRRRIPVIVICAAILVVTLVSDRRSGGDPQGFHAFTPGDGARADARIRIADTSITSLSVGPVTSRFMELLGPA